MAEQIPLLPLRVEALFENPTDSKDLRHFARTTDGQDYACKRVSDHPLMPCSEFLAYRIAEACRIAVPHSAVLGLANGEHAFGSRIEGGVTGIGNLPEGVSRFDAFDACADQISTILALDLFLANPDRHPGNLLFRRNLSGRLTVMSIDYGRGLFVGDFPEGPLPLGDCNTSTTLKLLKHTQTFRAPVAVFAISAVQEITAAHISRWMSEMPQEWLPEDHGDRLLAWWSSDKLPARIDAVLQCL